MPKRTFILECALDFGKKFNITHNFIICCSSSTLFFGIKRLAKFVNADPSRSSYAID